MTRPSATSVVGGLATGSSAVRRDFSRCGADTLRVVVPDEVNELARAVAELTALVRTQRAQAVQNGQALDRLSGTLGQVAMLIEDLQERVAELEEKSAS